MGGFLAILSSRKINAIKVMAFVPQWSIVPSIVPYEHRWQEYRRGIKEVKFPDLSNAFYEDCNYYILMGAHPSERQHTRYFLHHAKKPNVEVIEFSECAHNVAAYLKEKGLLVDTMNAALLNNLELTNFFLCHNLSVNKKVNNVKYMAWLLKSKLKHLASNRSPAL